MEKATARQNEALLRIVNFISAIQHTEVNLSKTDLSVLKEFIYLNSFGLNQNIRINQKDLAKDLSTNVSTLNRSIKKLISTKFIIKKDEKYSLNCEVITSIKKREIKAVDKNISDEQSRDSNFEGE